MTRRRDPHTLDIFAEPVSIGYGEDVTGRGPLANRITRLIKHVLDEAADAGQCRNDIAVALGKKLDRVVTKAQLDKWTAPSATDHRIPLDAFIALIEVTDDMKMLGFVPSLFGYAAVSNAFVDWMRLQQIEEQEEALLAERAILQRRVRSRR